MTSNNDELGDEQKIIRISCEGTSWTIGENIANKRVWSGENVAVPKVWAKITNIEREHLDGQTYYVCYGLRGEKLVVAPACTYIAVYGTVSGEYTEGSSDTGPM